MKQLGALLLLVAAVSAAGAPFIAPHTADARYPGLLNAPPTSVHIRDASGRWRLPFIYPWTRVSQLEQRYEANETTPVPLVWFADGHLVRSTDESRAPVLLLGADSFGRDVFSRLMFGARISLALAVAAAIGAVCMGALAGGIAGYAGGLVDDAVMRLSDFILVLPLMYVLLALRAAMPMVLPSTQVFILLLAIFALVGAPSIARGVRAIVRSERALDYSAAAVSLGATHARLLVRHLLPATRGFIVVQVTMLVPAFVVGEATLSYVGFGFPEGVASWGTMLSDASNIRAFADFPWLLSPAAAIFLVVLGLNLVLQGGRVRTPFDRPL